MLDALKTYMQSQSINGTVSQSTQVIMNLISNVENSRSDHIKFTGQSKNGVATVSINTMMALRGVKIDLHKLVNVDSLTPEARQFFENLMQSIEQSVQNAYEEAQNKIIATMLDAAQINQEKKK